jgi:hypothetical protein
VNTRGDTQGQKAGGGGEEGAVDLATERLVVQMVDLGFSEPWARETALRLRTLQRSMAGKTNAMSHLVGSTDDARAVLGLGHRSSVYKWVSRGYPTPMAQQVDEGQSWVTDQMFLLADC